MNNQTITTSNTSLGLGQRLGQGLFWIVKQFVQAGLVLCTGGVAYALIDGTAVPELAIPGMLVVMLLIGRFIYKPALGTAAVVNSQPAIQVESDVGMDDDHRRINILNSYQIDNIWHKK